MERWARSRCRNARPGQCDTASVSALPRPTGPSKACLGLGPASAHQTRTQRGHLEHDQSKAPVTHPLHPPDLPERALPNRSYPSACWRQRKPATGHAFILQRLRGRHAIGPPSRPLPSACPRRGGRNRKRSGAASGQPALWTSKNRLAQRRCPGVEARGPPKTRGSLRVTHSRGGDGLGRDGGDDTAAASGGHTSCADARQRPGGVRNGPTSRRNRPAITKFGQERSCSWHPAARKRTRPMAKPLLEPPQPPFRRMTCRTTRRPHKSADERRVGSGLARWWPTASSCVRLNTQQYTQPICEPLLSCSSTAPQATCLLQRG